MRELGTTKFSTETHSGANMLMNFELVDSQVLNPKLTQLWGMTETSFPILAATEGLGHVSKKTLKSTGDTQYHYFVEGRRRNTSRVAQTITTPQGKNGMTFEIVMEDNWLIVQHTAISPSGVQCRIQNDGVRVGKFWKYRLVVMTSSPNVQVPVEDLRAGAVWALGAPSIPASKSDGNRSNNQAPYKAINQYSYYRFSKGIEGNMGDRVVNIELTLSDGTTTTQWMPYEMKMWELDRRRMLEEDLWFSEYNRDLNNTITLIDEYTGEPVPKGAGIREQIKAVGNLETYSDLSLKLLDTLFDRITMACDMSAGDEIIGYCGTGFNRMFNKAVKEDARVNNFFTPLGDNVIDGMSDLMKYGKYFGKYKMLNGKVLVLKPVEIFDKGIRAEQQRLNAGVNPSLMYDGLPIMSYTCAFLDHSIQSNGERNIQYICEEGRVFESHIYKGVAKLPSSWAVAANSPLSTTKDIASYEVIGSQGVQIINANTCAMFELSV